ncbi:NADH-quinone oxidoreductase subunit C/D [Nitrospira moscoviensis]|uniref:Multifunctional fusion protein n=1 Tax=Nitrospira moscoviensis TaxID=42253 RepID=A0A0K2GEZ5_NITMO|nr:NADH-quinone oxidoreductase subunit C/D [Nitrospira moscoviensis]ALA59187.1 NADH-quinone oxidoreductase, subunits C and D [Nitrospira moscoviensis]
MTSTAPAGERPTIVEDVGGRFGADHILAVQPTPDGIPTIWVARDRLRDTLTYLKYDAPQPYRMLFDLSATDERARRRLDGLPIGAFTVFYHLFSLERNEAVRVKVALDGEYPTMPSIMDLWPNADWYEREAYDMFGIRFDGHPYLRRLLMPPWWSGHPLRKEHPARGTEMGRFQLPPEKLAMAQDALQFKPEDWGMKRTHEDPDFDYMFINLGPAHTGTHGVLRLVTQLAGEEIVDIVPDIGFHHRAKEKIAERQTWHTFIPYTDRVDYLQGTLNELPYCLSVERLAGIDVPPRAQVIRVMMCEFYRLASHLVWYGTFAQDVGALSPVFYMFNDRERIHMITESICGGRMHPNWFRIGGVAQDLPEGWDDLVRQFVQYLPARLDEYERLVMDNPIFKERTVGIGAFSLDDAIEWGATGPMLRACGLAWDLRKAQPYSGYDQFEFDVPVASHGDCYDRAVVHVLEMRQSLRIIRQCLDHMPAGPYKSLHPLATPPLKERTMQDIETLIHHFLDVSWGPVLPPGEAAVPTESSKGQTSYYLTSDGAQVSYRTRIRTPSFAHIQMVPFMSRGELLPDLLAILGSVDFVLSDVDR